MTNENSHEEEASEPEPHMKFEDGKLWGRDEEGEWVDVTPEPKRTGDPDLDALWRLPVSEVERIAEDDSHPLHEKAKQVQYEALQSWRDSLQGVLDAVMPKFDFGTWGSFPGFKWSQPQLLVGFKPWRSWGFEADDREETSSDDQEGAELEEVVEGEWTEFIESAPDSPRLEVPDIPKTEPSMTDLKALSEAQLEEMKKHTEHWVQSLNAMEDASKQAERSIELSEDANKTAQSNTIISVFALVVSAAAAIAAVISVMQ